VTAVGLATPTNSPFTAAPWAPPARPEIDDRSPAGRPADSPPLATYEDLGYRDVFWASRSYEDACDRVALRALLPKLPASGSRLIEAGAGFGRLAGEYQAFDAVVLLDASEVHVESARGELASDPRFAVALGDVLAIPEPDASFDVAVMVRVLHHFEDPGPAIRELGRIVRPGGALVLEYANKRNLKSIARRLLGRQSWSPFEPGSVAYKPFHYDHSPMSVRRALRAAGFRVERTRAVSLFRLPAITRAVSPELLARLEAPLQEPLGSVTPAPSVFVLARKLG
jgi:SAM-dependent methyltransferase